MIKSSGANAVKFCINRWQWENNADKYLPALDILIQRCAERELYVFLEWHTWLDIPNQTSKFEDNDKIQIAYELNDWRNFVINMATRYSNNPWVVGIIPMNEPPGVNAWVANGFTEEQAKATWRTNLQAIIDAIHTVNPDYLVEVNPIEDLIMFPPIDRPNLYYAIHKYYAWDAGWGGYADAYMTAITPEDFNNAYQQMVWLYQQILGNYRDTYNVPVANSETSMGKIVYKTGDPLPNSLKQFDDQMRMMIENKHHNFYFSCDTDYGAIGKYWGLLKEGIPDQWSIAGEAWYNAMQKYHPPITFTLTIIATTGGTTLPAPNTYTIQQGVTQQVVAIPNAGYQFTNWLLDGTSRTENPINMMMDKDHSLNAIFELLPIPPPTKQYLTIVAINGQTSPTQGTYQYEINSTVTITATPNSGYKFKEWLLDNVQAGTEPFITVTMDVNHTLVAIFEEIQIVQAGFPIWVIPVTLLGAGVLYLATKKK